MKLSQHLLYGIVSVLRWSLNTFMKTLDPVATWRYINLFIWLVKQTIGRPMENKRKKPLGARINKYQQTNDVFDWLTSVYIDYHSYLSRVDSVNWLWIKNHTLDTMATK